MPTAIDLSSFAGLTAMVLLTVNMLLGLLVVTNYNPRRDWPQRQLPASIFKIHNWTAYPAISVAVLHPVILLFSSTAGFKIVHLLWPVHSPGQRLYNTLGAVTFWAFGLVVVTSYFRPQLRYRPWRKLHWVAYFAGASMFVHGTLIDPKPEEPSHGLSRRRKGAGGVLLCGGGGGLRVAEAPRKGEAAPAGNPSRA